MKKTAVVAIGGNSLIKDNNKVSIEDQLETASETCEHLIGIIKEGYNLVVTHGNGPQVGFSLIRSDLASSSLPLVPMDACGADTQGTIGYMLQQSLHNHFKQNGMNNIAATVVTQVKVDINDPAFKNPTKPVGRFYDKERAFDLKEKLGWTIVEDSGRGYRRVVPSPIPIEIIERPVIQDLVEQGIITIAVGGGGIPVVEDENGQLRGCAAVIDKDHASSLLARNIKAELFIISTAVEKVSLNFNTENQRDIDEMNVTEAKKYIEEGHFAKGSMLPKIQASIQYLEGGGKEVIITNPENITRAIENETGTRIFN